MTCDSNSTVQFWNQTKNSIVVLYYTILYCIITVQVWYIQSIEKEGHNRLKLAAGSTSNVETGIGRVAVKRVGTLHLHDGENRQMGEG